MPPSLLDQLPRPLHSAVKSAGYRAARWAAARQVLGNRLAKCRIKGMLGETLGRWGVAQQAAPASAEGLQLTFGLEGDRLWLRDSLAAQPMERTLLHLPALRGFWRQELRQAHFDALKAMVPQTWVAHEPEDATLPPGAVIHGLNIPSWHDLPRLEGRTPAVVPEGDYFTEKPVTRRKLNATYHRDDKRRVVLRSLEALS